jgi:hypothetical protein
MFIRKQHGKMASPLLEIQEARSRPFGPGSRARWSGSNALMIVKESDAGAWLLFNASHCRAFKLEYETVIIRA